MSPRRVSIAVAVTFLLLTGCKDYPDPATPTLLSVHSGGGHQQVCPSGGCPTPPTTSLTDWELTPAYYTVGTKDRWNRRARFVLSTPSATDLAVSSTHGSGFATKNVVMEESVGDPAFPDKFRVATIDDGTTKRWFVGVIANYCVEPITFHFVNVGHDPGRPRSAPLDVTLRLPATGMSCNDGRHEWLPVAYGSGPAGSSTSGTGAQCPAGEQNFTVCEYCSAHPGATTPRYFESSHCATSWTDLRTIFGYGPGGVKSAAGCTLSQGQCPN